MSLLIIIPFDNLIVIIGEFETTENGMFGMSVCVFFPPCRNVMSH